MSGLRLSPAQEAIWYEQQMRHDTSNGGALSVTLLGELDEAQIESACAAIVRRHAALRTLVRVVGEQPVLDVQPPEHPLSFTVLDLPCPPTTEIAATRGWRAGTGMRYFDITREPGIAFQLLRHGPDRRTLLIDVHHVCFDGRSKFIFARDFVAAMTAIRAGGAPGPEPLPYPDWAEATDDVLAEADRYWADADPATCPRIELPHGETAAAGLVGTTGDALVDGAARARLVELAAAAGTTLFGGLLACLAVQLYAYGNERMVVCIPVDSSTAQSRGTIGLAVNVVPVLLTLRGDDTFASALTVARDATRRLKEFRHVPLRVLPVSRVARALPTRISLSYLRLPTDVPQIPGLRTDWDFVAPNSARTFDLMLQFRDADDHLVTRMDYCGDLDQVAASAAMQHFRSVLHQVLDAPDTPLRKLPLVPAESIQTGAEDVLAEPLGALIAAGRPGSATAAAAGSATDRSAVLQAALSGTASAGVVGAVVHLLGGGNPYDPARIRAVVAELGITTLVASYPVVRCLADGGDVPPTLHDVFVPMADLRPSPQILALVGAGVRLHAHVADARCGIVATQTCTLADLVDGYVPTLRDVAPGLRLTVRGPDGRILPQGTAGDLTIEVRSGEPRRFAAGIRGLLDRTGAIRHLGPPAATIRHGGLTLNLPDVERHLAAHPDVEEAAVVARGARPAAYLVPRPGSGFGAREARLHLKRRGGFGQLRVAEVSVVTELPRRPDGEVDRAAIVGGAWTEAASAWQETR
jgi:Condensation domain/AMP-binding enzyme C-terminal domain